MILLVLRKICFYLCIHEYLSKINFKCLSIYLIPGDGAPSAPYLGLWGHVLVPPARYVPASKYVDYTIK